MEIEVNGKSMTLDQDPTVASLVAMMGLVGQRVAVEVNQALVVKKDWEKTPLHAGDRVEVVSFVGGG